MAQPASRQELIDYALRQNGAPVLEVNVAEEQLQDLMDDAIQYYQERHYDGITKIFLKYKITQEDIDRGRVKDPDCPYYTNHSWYDWFGGDACGHGKWKMVINKHLKVDSKSVKTNQDKGPQYYSLHLYDPKFDPDLFLTGEYPRVGGIDMGGIEGLGMHIPWIKAPKGYKNTSGMKQLKM